VNIVMVGTGYVGLVSAACFSDFGYHVVCVDKDTKKIAALSAGEIPIYEPGLNELVTKSTKAGRLSFTTDLASAINSADIVFIAVGTPSLRGDGHADTTYVQDAAREIAQQLNGPIVIVIKSTVPVGTAQVVHDIVADHRPTGTFSVISNPEFLREGSAIEDFKRPDRIIIGIADDSAREVMKQLYRPISLSQTPIYFTDRNTAELTKYAANAFLALKITFINEMADLCEKSGANVQDLARGIGLDQRIGGKFLQAGPGFGGSCFPKDIRALIRTALDFDVPACLVDAVNAVNENRKRTIGRKVIEACGGNIKGKTIGIQGLTFKPNTDDMREAPSIDIVNLLQSKGAIVRAFDPVGMQNAKRVLSGVTFTEDPYDCVRDADAMVLVTEWDVLRALDLRRIKNELRVPTIVDLRNVYLPSEMKKLGIKYVSIGR
jgi:UDPglucose 6-dehydrogenase